MNVTTTLTTLTCYKCGILFAYPDYLNQKHRETGDSFYCPNGHSQAYCENEVDRLNKMLDQQRHARRRAEERTEREREQRFAAERQASARKGVITRIKNRVAKGVCPVCNRHFDSLQHHMEHQHPGWTPDA